MKKFIYIFALVGLVAASCSKVPVTEIDNQAPATGTYTYVLNASMPDEITKTTYAGDKTFAWSTGDQISVLFHKGDDNKFFTLTTAKGGSASAKFEGEITDVQCQLGSGWRLDLPMPSGLPLAVLARGRLPGARLERV